MPSVVYIFILSVLGIVRISSTPSSGFLVTAPKYLLSESKEKICISIHNRRKLTPVTVNLLELNSGNVIASTRDFVKGNTTCLSLHIPSTNNTDGKLQVQLPSYEDSDVNDISEQNVKIKQDPLVTIIAIEKPVYRPGETLRFRIFSLTHKLKVHKDQLKRVWIESPNGITLEQWLNLKTDLGLIQLDFALSEESLLGEWKIKVQHQRDIVEERTFTVKEYILPWFEVIIKQPKEILADADVINFEVCARYSYGAAVNGDVKVEINLKSIYKNDRPKVIRTGKLDSWSGCKNLPVTGAELYFSDPEVQPYSVEVAVTVTETASKKSETVNSAFDIFKSAVQLQFHCSEYFKSGLPYKGKLRVLSAEGQPTVAVDLPIQICMKEYYTHREINKQCWNYSTDYSSEVVFTLPPRPNTTNSITVTAISIQHENKFYSEEQRWELLMVQPKATQGLKPWYSPSRSYIDVSTVSPVVCNTLHSVHVRYTVSSFNDPSPTFYFVAESRGDIIQIGSINPGNEKNLTDKVLVGFPPARTFILPLLITPDMSPETRLAVYYVRDDGEVIAASTVLVVDHCFPNKVRVRWSEHTVKPGSKLSLNLRAHPFSLCAISVVDSVVGKAHLNKSLTSELVWRKLEQYKIPFLDESSLNCDNKPHRTYMHRQPYDWDLKIRRKKRTSYAFPVMNDYVDAITAFNDIGIVVMTDLKLETRPCVADYPSQSSDNFNNRNNLLPVSLIAPQWKANDDNVDDNNIIDVPSMTNYKAKSFRNFFPEAWLWKITNVSHLGELTLDTNAPHSVTSWDTSVFCINDEVGFGLSEPSTFVTVLPFFLTLSVPNVFIRTESLGITVVVYNYLGHSVPVKISVDILNDLGVTDPTTAVQCVTELSSKSFNFTVTAHKTGLLNITVTATILPALDYCNPGIYEGVSDTVVKTIKVKAEGFFISKSYSALFCGNDELKSPWNLTLPQNIIQNSARAYVTISPEILGPALQMKQKNNYNPLIKVNYGLGDFVQIPAGCGEQNMMRLAPNIQVLQYLETVHIHNNEQLKKKAINHIQKGYQRQLQYRHPDGSYSGFGPKQYLGDNEEGSIWLTAFVIKSLGQALNVVTIDNKMLQESLNWIVSKQMENGCFPMIGHIFQKELKGGLGETESTIALTAYIVAALHKSGLPLPASVASNAEFCLSAEKAGADLYSLALVTYAFTIVDNTSQKTQNYLQRLTQLARHDKGLIWWEKQGGSLALNIEITGYAVMSLIKVGGSNNIVIAQGAVQWLSTKRNNNGGFVSTQDTVIGLEALTTFAAAVPVPTRPSLLINVTEVSNNEFHSNSVGIDYTNNGLQQQVAVTNVPSVLLVNSRGEGCAVIQALLTYNVDENTKGDGFELSVSTVPVTQIDECYFQKMEICVRYTLPDLASNMAIVVINLISGYIPDRSSLPQMTGIERWEEEVDENKLIIYLEKVEFTQKCFTFVIQKIYDIINPAPAIVTVTDYYHPEHSNSVNYTILCNNIPVIFDNNDDDLSTLIRQLSSLENEQQKIKDILLETKGVQKECRMFLDHSAQFYIV